ncbi:MAG TPA: TAT-variant-translocated molybdopterin oxidoreductase [Pyrinomonadaceae bacterium]|jgi:molybdopterin-containing oxidoreductase family iron-sulfur binding subunit|nr:TAT-variant-translocated molybdopterin oxidoreductase [Pyrinomonadaceae bacterium]
MSNDRHINFKLLRDRILGAGSADASSASAGRQYWRSLEELADSPVFEEFVRREYPAAAEEWNDPVERRTFLKIMGASLALAGLSGCVIQPPEKIVPYIKQPEEEVPGRGLWFASAFTLGGVATPVLVRSNEGRPTKVEGNPDHPSTGGSTATDIFSQASILSLYDPDRSQTPLYRSETRPWTAFVAEIRGLIEKENDGIRAKKGAGLRFLTETITSPSLAAQMKQILTDFPEAKWHQYEPVNRDNARAGAVMAFGQDVHTTYDFSKADRILSLGSDFLNGYPGNLRYARDYARRRGVDRDRTESGTGVSPVNHAQDARATMNRLYVIESTPTITGANADHRFSINPAELAQGIDATAKIGHLDESQSEFSKLIVSIYGSDLQYSFGKSIVIAGHDQPPVVHAWAHDLNRVLENVGQTVFYSDPIEANSVDQTQSLRELVTDIDAGKVETLIIIGGNPAYNTPIDLRLDLNRLNKVKLRAHLSLYNNETSDICHWHIPAAHYLESWSDTRAYDGTVTIVQPLIAPLYDGKTAHEMLALFSDNYDKKPYEIVKEYWRSYRTASGSERVQNSTPSAGRMPANRPQDAGAPTDFESSWRKWLHDGFIPNTALPAKTVAVKSDWASSLAQNAGGAPALPANTFELVFKADPSIYDGRFANNGWLQELPKPLTKITWDNVALVSPTTARKLGCLPPNYEEAKKGREAHVDMITLGVGDKTINKSVPVWILPGQPEDVITIHLGYGRPLSGRIGSELGFNAYDIRRSDSPWTTAGAWARKTNQRYVIATTQLQFDMMNRDILRESPVAEYLKEKDALREEREEQQKENRELSLYPDFDYKNQGNGYAWGMSIDLNSCVGCNACMIACQSENNIPIVGKEQVARGRSMHWIRVDAYFKGDEAQPEGPFFQPVPCMHCENAPCEPVCPVHATAHSAEGLNDMVYNRCVGTRYCSNNCPYKVRRFNFLLYQDWDTPTYQLMRNPDVSVRSRGVMEKCTYCVQRIQAAKIQSEIEGRPVRDGEIVTACQSVCPTEAIVFGNINDPNSKVSKLKALERDYSLLGELNTRPRTTYLSALRNPNPKIKS